MKPTIIMESMRSSLGEYLLVSVTNGIGAIGMCNTSVMPNTIRDTLYVGTESIVNVYSATNDKTAHRQIWQCTSIEKSRNIVGSRLKDACEGYFYESNPLAKAIHPVLELLTDGLYAVHVDNVYPTDGAGNFFWNAYIMKHELNGSEIENSIFGKDKEFSPPFLVPTESCTAYSERNVFEVVSKLKHGRRVGGIAYHLSGMFSALLDGHINAAACLVSGNNFPCVIIEPLKEVYFRHNDETGYEEAAAIGCPYVKIPIKSISRNLLENFFINRNSLYPDFYADIRMRADKTLQPKNAMRGATPLIAQHVEKLPDAEMIASAFAITELTDEQIQLLLEGETRQNDRVIISPNYYESIVYACNFLQYKDPERFIDFTISILNTPALSATYRYVAERLRYVIDARVNELFKNIAASEDPAYAPIKEIAQRYLKRYSEHMENSVIDFLESDEIVNEADNEAGMSGETGTYSPNSTKKYSSMALKHEIEKDQK